MTGQVFDVPTEHPTFAGHFPGRPILPGVVLLDEAARRIAAALDLEQAPGLRINRAKFLRPALPGDALRLHWETTKRGDIEFRIERGSETLAEGSLRLGGS